MLDITQGQKLAEHTRTKGMYSVLRTANKKCHAREIVPNILRNASWVYCKAKQWKSLFSPTLIVMQKRGDEIGNKRLSLAISAMYKTLFGLACGSSAGPFGTGETTA